MKPIHVTFEHTTGILKARFPFLKAIRTRIAEDKESLKKLLKLVTCAVILHKILIDKGESNSWLSDNDVLDINDPNCAPDELNLPIDGEATADLHCQQLMHFLNETYSRN